MEILEITRALIALPLVLFVPGYAWSRVLFREGEVDGIERVVLSIGLSIALVPLAIFFLNRAGMPITALSSFATIVALTILALVAERVMKRC